METKNIILKLRTERGLSQDELWYTVSMRIYNSLRTMYWR